MRRTLLTLLLSAGLFIPLAHADHATLVKYFNEGVATMKAEQYPETERLMKLALQAGGPTDPNRINAYFILGQVYLRQKRYAEAESMMKQVISLYPSIKEVQNDPEMLTHSLTIIGVLHRDQEHFAEAEAAFKQLLPLEEKRLGSDHQRIGSILLDLGTACAKQEKMTEAKQYYQQAIAIMEKAPAGQAPNLESTRKYLAYLDSLEIAKQVEAEIEQGQLAFANGDKETASAHFGTALSMARQLFGPNHPSVKALEHRIAEAQAIDTSPDYLKQLERGIERWHDKTRTVRVYIAPGQDVPGWRPEYVESVKTAFLTWQQALNDRITFEFTDRPADVDVNVTWYDKQSVRRRDQQDITTVGANVKEVWGRYLAKNDIEIYLNSRDGTTLSGQKLYGTLLHEVGHSLGICGHSNNPTDVMFPYSERGRDTATRLSQRDIATINAIYRLKAKTSSPENVRLSNFEDFRRKLVARGEYSDDTPMITFSGENPIVAANGKGQAGGRKKRRWWDTGPFDGMMVMPGWTNMRY